MRREHWLWTVLAGLGLGLFAAGTAVYGQETGDRGGAEAPRVTRVVHLHGPASDLGEALQALSTRLGVAMQTGPGGKTLLLNGPEDGIEAVLAALQALDQHTRQIEVRLLIAELTGAADETLKFDADFDAAVAQVRRLQKDGGVAALRRVQLTTIEGQQCVVQFGEQKPLVAGQNVTPRGRVNTFQFDSSGTMIELTARVEPSGVVALALNAETSRIVERDRPSGAEAGAEEFVPSGKSTATVRSTITVPPGRTVAVTDFGAEERAGTARLIVLLSARVVE
jgi:type II secretory pathway component GspD/PulD (secretin)